MLGRQGPRMPQEEESSELIDEDTPSESEVEDVNVRSFTDIMMLVTHLLISSNHNPTTSIPTFSN